MTHTKKLTTTLLSFFYFAAKSENAGQMSHQSCVKIKILSVKEHSNFFFSIVLGGAMSMASEDKGKQMGLLIWHVLLWPGIIKNPNKKGKAGTAS